MVIISIAHGGVRRFGGLNYTRKRMMVMTDPTPEMVAMARRIAAEDAESRGAGILAGNFRLGNCDDTISVRCALAAIIETSEMAAKWHDKRMEERFAEHGTREPDTNATYYSGRYGETLETLDEEDEAAATALRAYDHIKPENG